VKCACACFARGQLEYSTGYVVRADGDSEIEVDDEGGGESRNEDSLHATVHVCT
jgi:hypothetical protein